MITNYTTSYNDGRGNFINEPNQKVDLSDVLSVVIKNSPNFISNFRGNGIAMNRKHEWLEEWVKPKTIEYTSATTANGVTVFAVADSKGWEVGDIVHIKDYPAIFEITTIAPQAITVVFIAANGAVIQDDDDVTVTPMTAENVPAANSVLFYDSHPINEAASTGPSGYEQSIIEYNVTQIFRREVTLSGTSLATAVYGSENSIDHQIERAIYRLTLDLNHAAIYGSRIDRSASSKGMCGGLYHYGTQPGGLGVNGCKSKMDLKLLNDAAQSISDCGANPSMIVCSPLMCRVISAICGSNIQVVREDKVRGSYVGQIVNDSTGTLMTVHSEPEILDTEVWVVDPSGFGYVPMQGRGLTAENTTLPGFDGIRQTIQGEITLEFKNAKQRLCRIYNIEHPSMTLSSDLYVPKVIVNGGHITTIPPQEEETEPVTP